MKTKLFLSFLLILITMGCENAITDDILIDATLEEALLGKHEFCTTDESSMDFSDKEQDLYLTEKLEGFVLAKASNTAVGQTLFDRIRVYNPTFKDDFIITMPKRTKIHLPDGTVIPLWQTEEFVDKNYRHNLRGVKGNIKSGNIRKTHNAFKSF